MAASELLAHRLDHLPLARNDLQRLGDVLADLRELLRAAAPTGTRRGHHHTLPRQMLGERLAPGPAAAGEPLHLCRPGCRLFGRQFVLGRARLKLVELELQLVEKPLLALRTLAVKRATELLDHQLQGGDLRFGIRHLRRRVGGPRLGLGGFDLGVSRLRLGIDRLGFRHSQRRLQRVDVRSVRHARKRITTTVTPLRQSCPVSLFAARQPARDGRQVRTGLRQSIPSSR